MCAGGDEGDITTVSAGAAGSAARVDRAEHDMGVRVPGADGAVREPVRDSAGPQGVGPPGRVRPGAVPGAAGGRHGRQPLRAHPVRRRAKAVSRHAAGHPVRAAGHRPPGAGLRLHPPRRPGPRLPRYDGEVRHHHAAQEPPHRRRHAPIAQAPLLNLSIASFSPGAPEYHLGFRRVLQQYRLSIMRKCAESGLPVFCPNEDFSSRLFHHIILSIRVTENIRLEHNNARKLPNWMFEMAIFSV